LLLSASFCAGPGDDKSPKLVIVHLETAKDDTAKFITTPAELNSGDSLMFSAKKIKETATVLIPMGDELCLLDSADITCKAAGINFLFIPLQKNGNEFTSKKFIVNKHSKRTVYEYSAYVHKYKKMAEQKSSPKIIVDP
jgi:hypothetical protein